MFFLKNNCVSTAGGDGRCLPAECRGAGANTFLVDACSCYVRTEHACEVTPVVLCYHGLGSWIVGKFIVFTFLRGKKNNTSVEHVARLLC